MIRFVGISLPVADLDRSIEFYESLGFVTEGRSERFALLRLGGGTIGLLRVGEVVRSLPMRGLVQIELSVDDLDALHRELRELGVPVGEPKDRPWERQMQVRDPDGFTVEFAEGHRGA